MDKNQSLNKQWKKCRMNIFTETGGLQMICNILTLYKSYLFGSQYVMHRKGKLSLAKLCMNNEFVLSSSSRQPCLIK